MKRNIAAAVHDVVFWPYSGTNYISKIANMRMPGRLDERKKPENSSFLLGTIYRAIVNRKICKTTIGPCKALAHRCKNRVNTKET